MDAELQAALERAKGWKPTVAELFEQKVSWCYGMQKYPPALTKDQVREMLRNPYGVSLVDGQTKTCKSPMDSGNAND